ncbi:unnamed protein product [Callosobruchus maculatus]|uniref:Uncharacterized protein n=1 Tax=Callosobruchus maculatus TaxID=64391 RepID=A0A653C3U2_CALMS|nr:unnamed protein product [Callosobruchus maculatus]
MKYLIYVLSLLALLSTLDYAVSDETDKDAVTLDNNCRLQKEYISILEKIKSSAAVYTRSSVWKSDIDDLIMKLKRIKSQHEAILKLNEDILRYSSVPSKLIKEIATDKEKTETFIMKLESALSKAKNEL